jgi:hypothetical protein
LSEIDVGDRHRKSWKNFDADLDGLRDHPDRESVERSWTGQYK